MKLSIILCSSLLLACGGKRPPARQADLPPTAALPTGVAPDASAFVSAEGEQLGDVLSLAGGRAWVALVHGPGEHGPVAVRAIVDGKRVELFGTSTGDCYGGTIAAAFSRDGAVVVQLGQVGYPGCGDDTEGMADPDVTTHVECARLTWSPDRGQVELTRTPPVDDPDAVPTWCDLDEETAAVVEG